MKKSVIYINYCPYENSGHILDYLLGNFQRVFLFSMAYHTLNGKKELNKLTIFENGIMLSEENLFYMNIPQNLVLFLIPIRSMMSAIQIISRAIKIKLKYGKIDIFFSVNAFTVSIGMLLKKIGIVKKNTFWVWDYYPIDHPNILIRILRWIYWQFDKISTHADRIIFLNHRLAKVRIRAKLIDKSSKKYIVPIGIGEMVPARKKSLKKIRIGFLGVLKRSQGLDMLFDCAELLANKFNDISFDIIGSGPDEAYFKKKARRLPIKFIFHGLVSEKELKDILYNCTIGIAPYTPEDSNVSRYGDPAKIKWYIEYNLPSIITDVFEFSKELEKSGAGVFIEYGNPDSLVKAIKKILRNYDRYVNNTLKLQSKYYYKKIYSRMFGNC